MSMHDDQDARRMLTRGLVHNHLHLYDTSVHFRSAIDVLVESFLPALVDGLATQAKEKVDAALEEALKFRSLDLDPEVVAKFFPRSK